MKNTINVNKTLMCVIQYQTYAIFLDAINGGFQSKIEKQ
jgi:hypothetical protein